MVQEKQNDKKRNYNSIRKKYIRQFTRQEWNMYLHEDKEIFKDIIERVAEDTGRAVAIIEKDYYQKSFLMLYLKVELHFLRDLK